MTRVEELSRRIELKRQLITITESEINELKQQLVEIKNDLDSPSPH